MSAIRAISLNCEFEQSRELLSPGRFHCLNLRATADFEASADTDYKKNNDWNFLLLY